MRCPEAVVGAVNDMIAKALEIKKLGGRIDKLYQYYEPGKGEDSRRFPHIELIETTVQRDNANYFGRYIEQCIRAIPADEAQLAADSNEPVALIIGSNPYRRQVEQHLASVGLFTPSVKPEPDPKEEALKILSEDPDSNLGWRLILSCGDKAIARSLVRKAAEDGVPLKDVIDEKERDEILRQAQIWKGKAQAADTEDDDVASNVAITLYEGSKGRSAQYVFLVGLHSKEMPKKAVDVQDLEICRFLVGLTRTKKKCTVLYAKNAMGKFKQRSEFLDWIKPERFAKTKIDAAYWQAR